MVEGGGLMGSGLLEFGGDSTFGGIPPYIGATAPWVLVAEGEGEDVATGPGGAGAP
jgi:hypothetical protein